MTPIAANAVQDAVNFVVSQTPWYSVSQALACQIREAGASRTAFPSQELGNERNTNDEREIRKNYFKLIVIISLYSRFPTAAQGFV